MTKFNDKDLERVAGGLYEDVVAKYQVTRATDLMDLETGEVTGFLIKRDKITEAEYFTKDGVKYAKVKLNNCKNFVGYVEAKYLVEL